jgi:hypothetical protein
MITERLIPAQWEHTALAATGVFTNNSTDKKGKQNGNHRKTYA